MRDDEVLGGGMASAGSVRRIGNEVVRPARPSTAAVHALLRHVRQAGFDGAPEPLAIDEAGYEHLSFIPGDVPHVPYPRWAMEDEALASTAILLRRFHDATEGFSPPPGVNWSHELADQAGGSVICHNDIRPENVVFRNGTPVAFLDFEFAAPGRRFFELAHFALTFVPIEGPEGARELGADHVDPVLRLRVLADAYGLPPGRNELLDAIEGRITAGAEFVKDRVAAGDPTFVKLWSDKTYRDRYECRIEWFATNRPVLESALG